MVFFVGLRWGIACRSSNKKDPSFDICIICILVPKKQQFAQKKATAVNVLSQPNQSVAQVPRVTILLTIKQNVQRQQNIFLAKQKDLFPDVKARGVPLCCCLFEISCHISDFCICWKRITILWFLHMLAWFPKLFSPKPPGIIQSREKKHTTKLGEKKTVWRGGRGSEFPMAVAFAVANYGTGAGG